MVNKSIQNIKNDCTLINIIFEAGETKDNYLNFIDSKGKYTISYNAFLNEVLSLLGHLQEMGAVKGEKVILQFENNQDFVHLFWACILGGMIPVPLSCGNNDQTILKIKNVIKQLKNCTIASTENVFEYLDATEAILLVKRRYIYNNKLLSGKKGKVADIYSTDIAYYQFSSGSTGNPKGIKLTHENLLTNIDDSIAASRLNPESAFCSWLPLSHDMGLIGGHFVPFRQKINQIIVSTSFFIRRPLIWLKTLDEFRITHTMTSNFGCRYVINALEANQDFPKLDLSNLKVLYNGSEPISSKNCDAFLEMLKYTGLSKKVMFNVYGLAEASLAVSFPPYYEEYVRYHLNRNTLSKGKMVDVLISESDKSICFVSVGKPLQNCSLRICDDNNVTVKDRIIGNIQIKGKNVTSGYLEALQTEKLLTDDGWLKTGDLGVMIEGNLVVTGRSKELIIINGQNFYPHDIEFELCKLFSIEQGKIVIASHDVPSEKTLVLVFVEYRKSVTDFTSLRDKFKDAIAAYLGSDNCEVIPVKQIPKTTSGKLQRLKLVKEFIDGVFADKQELAGILPILISPSEDFSSARKKIVALLQDEIIKQNVEKSAIHLDVSFMDFGLSSNQLVFIQGRISRLLGIKIDTTIFFSYPNIGELSQHLAKICINAHVN
jgi:iturin family lipopeptide synthetase A